MSEDNVYNGQYGGEINKVLILNDLYDIVHHDKIDILFVRQIYVTIFIMQLVSKNGSITIHINDRSGIPYQVLWEKNSILYDFINPFLINQPWETTRFLSYDLIICHPDYEDVLYEYLENELRNASTGGLKMPLLYSFIGSDDIAHSTMFEKVDQLFKVRGKFYVDNAAIKEVNSFKESINVSFLKFAKDEQEAFYKDVLVELRETNARQDRNVFQNVLILDDYRRKLYIGDSCIWLVYLKKIILNLAGKPLVRINCNNANRYQKLNNMLQDSFGADTSFSNYSWEQMNFEEYDLIICHSDLILKFLQYLSMVGMDKIKNASVYNFSLRYELSSGNDPFNWNYLIKHPCNALEPRHPINLTPSLKNNRYKEIYISMAEMQGADKWLENNGISNGDQLIALVTDASHDLKVMSPHALLRLIRWFISFTTVKILLFETENASNFKYVVQVLSSDELNRIIIVKDPDIRGSMGVLTSRYIKAVIGPCTGLLHLADGLFYYLKNKSLLEGRKIPLMVVYTGRQDSNYHPIDWWINSNVKCVVLCRNAQGRNILQKLTACPLDKTTYFALTLPAKEISGELMIDFIKENFPRFMEKILFQATPPEKLPCH